MRISLMASVLVMIIVITGVTNFYMINGLHQRAEILRRDVIQQILLTADMKNAVIQVQQWLTDISATRGADGYNDGFDQAAKHAQKYNELSESFKKVIKDNKKLIALQIELDLAFVEFYDFGKEMAAVYIAQGPSEGNKLMEKFDPYAEKISALLEKQGLAVRVPIKEHFDSIYDDISFFKIITLFFAMFGSLLGIVLSVLLVKSIVRRLTSIIASLAEASSQTSSATEQLSSASQSLSSGANDQASSIEESSASLEELSGMVEKNVSNAKQTAEMSGRVFSVSTTGNDFMNELQKSMEEILTSNKKIEELVKVIGNIGDKTQIIDEIVFQTKLLSFNASVEAERAGEQGRGFAVVAQEIGNLAKMSDEAAKEIALIVKQSIQDATSITVENKEKVNRGNGQVVETAKALKQVIELANNVKAGTDQILSASQDQSLGIKQINIAMGQLDKVAQQNAAAAEETASTSEQLNAQTTSLNVIVNELNEFVSGNNKIKNG